MRNGWKAAFIALLLGGCASSGPTDPDAPDYSALDEPVRDQDLDATSKTGILRCIAVDDGIRPLEGVTVRLQPTSRETTTDGDGACGFEDLQPGTYFVHAEKSDYTPAHVAAEVRAGDDEPPIIRLVLTASANQLAHVTTVKSDLYIQHAVSVAGYRTFGLGPPDDLLSGFLMVELGQNVSWTQAEVVWEATTPLGVEIEMWCSVNAYDWDGGDYRYQASAEAVGPSMLPAVFPIDDEEAQAYDLRMSCFFLPLEDDLVPVGAIVDQELQAFTTIFYNMLPQPGWFFTRDGEHPPP